MIGNIIFFNVKVDEVLSLSSENELKNGGSPGPMVEVLFWDAKCYNLESLHEQVKRKVQKKFHYDIIFNR